jgi:predicted O-methyltransferase YrrM
MNKTQIRKITGPLYPVLDILLSPFTLLASVLLFAIRKMKVSNMPLSKSIFKMVGVFPITNHYYEPLFDDRLLKQPLDRDRFLPGIDWNNRQQLDLLAEFNYKEELLSFPVSKKGSELSFYFNNPSLGPGDAEYLYCMVRHFKPKQIIEIGSGYSTLMAMAAIQKNKQQNEAAKTRTVCIEPFEMPWLEETGVEVIRKKVEEIEVSFFQALEPGDFLFIDSSHMIRPQGDVLFEILQILPGLQKGVIVHVHDIFSPKDYGKLHLVDEVLFWNEQYLLEAFLSCNKDFEIIGAVNYLKNHFPDEIYSKLPWLKNQPQHEPGSFWIRRK